MAHYHDDGRFRSKKAIALVGTGETKEKLALSSYWAAALQRQPDLEFRVQDVFEGHGMLVISYLNQRGVLAAETLSFDADGKVIEAAACHRPAQADEAGEAP